MSRGIFSDSAKGIQHEQDENGIYFTMACQGCEQQFTMLHRWPEVRKMLDGHPVQGVRITGEGFEVSVQCSIDTDVCTHVNKYIIKHAELEQMADAEVARRKRLKRARGY